jgi:predicted permease
MHSLLQDFRYTLRMMRKNPGLTSVIVLSLAIGIGANSAIFSVVDALLLRPLPFPESGRLAAIWLHSPAIGIFRDWPSPGQYVDIQKENHSFDEMAIAQLRPKILTGLDKPTPINCVQTSSTLLQLLGAKPIYGRILLPEEDKPGKPAVAILTYAVWNRLFQSDPQIVGKSIILDGASFSVAGILGPQFLLNSEVMPAEGPMDKVDVFLPLPLGDDAAQRRGDENYNIVVRLKPGVSIKAAQADIDVIAGRIREKDKRDRSFGMTVIGLREQVVGDVRRALLVLLGSVALVLLIACANVANLLLTRAAGRDKEIAIRTALGARGSRLVRQLLTESVVLAVMGGAAGLLIAQWTLHALRTINPGNIPRVEDISINGAVLGFTFGIAVITGVLFGTAPAWRALKSDLNTSLKAGGRSGQTEGGLHLTRNRLRGLLVVSELAFSLMLLIGAGLLIRSFVRLQSVPPGFATDHTLSMQVSITGPKYRDDNAVLRFYQEAADRVGRLPDVESEGWVSALPLTGSVGWGGITVEGYTPPPGQELQVDIRTASATYFRTMKIPLKEGRFFSDFDNAAGQQVAIIDEKFAQRFWPHGSPVGKHVWFNPKKPITIVGAVGLVKQYGLDNDGKIAVYFPATQAADGGMFLVARTSSDAAGSTSAIIDRIHAVDSNAAVYEIRSMQDRLYDSLARQRFSTTMLGVFAALALVLAAVGVYGVMSYLVAQSTRDIGLRVALGAQPGNILGLVIRQGMELAGLGIVVGLIGAWLLTRAMASLLYGVSTTDTITFSVLALLLAAIAFVATVIPAYRATSVDPMVALRDE